MIRIATTDDLNSIFTILKEVHSFHYKYRPDIFKDLNEPAVLNRYRTLIESSDSEIYVYLLNNEIIGYMTLMPTNSPPHPILLDRKIVLMQELAILKDYQRKGYGKELYNKALKYVEAKQADKLELMVWSFNKGAIDFYLKLGMDSKLLILEA